MSPGVFAFPICYLKEDLCSVSWCLHRARVFERCLLGARRPLSLANPPQGGVRSKNSAVTSTSQSSTSQPSSTDNGIQHHSGPVMNNPHGINVYLIWYGDWSNNTEPAIVTDFVKHLGGTAYFNINCRAAHGYPLAAGLRALPVTELS